MIYFYQLLQNIYGDTFLLGDYFLFFTTLHFIAVACIGLHLIWVRRTVSVALAWLGVVLIFPFLGLIAYFLIGGKSIGRALMDKAENLKDALQQQLNAAFSFYQADQDQLPFEEKAISRLAASHFGSPVVAGNRIDLLTDSLTILSHFIADIEAAKKSLHLEFYIWAIGGDADKVAEALIRAAKRGIDCKVLLDSLGSKDWLNSAWPKRLRDAGVELIAALPIHFGNFQFRRVDLRLHRKIFVIDEVIVWTGSMNLVDPRTFKQDANVGEWVDAMLRVQGPVVSEFETTFQIDWSVCNPRVTQFYPRSFQQQILPGTILAQKLSTGPIARDDILYQFILSALIDARESLIITTPYFGADDGLMQALMASAHRGVDVTLIVPRKNDSKLVALSSRSYYEELMAAGVRIAEFNGGLLHTKSLLIDRRIAMFGSVNFDMRSLHLNFEISLLVYNTEFCQRLNALLQTYIQKSSFVDPVAWAKRSRLQRLKENAAYLISPLL